MKLSALVLLLLIALNCSRADDRLPHASDSVTSRQDSRAEQTTQLRAAVQKVEPFFRKMGKPASGDWLESHNEPGQTFEEYLEGEPTVPTNARQKLYVVALGDFGPVQKRIVGTAAEYLAVFYDLPVERLPQTPLRVTHPDIRHNRFTRTRQIKTGHILEKVLVPMLPDDAAALIAFTQDDLYPDDTMNYVFGQASLEKRVAVWSLARLDDNVNQQTFLSRTLKIAAHESGHMFSMRHCTKYECLMSGTNHLGETDRRPIDACPECTAKICWLSDTKMSDRYRRLAEFCRKNKLEKEARDFLRKAAALALEPKSVPPPNANRQRG